MNSPTTPISGKDGKKVKEKLKKLAARVEEEDFSPDLEMVKFLQKLFMLNHVTAQIYCEPNY